jgi:hypothetical protein
MNVHVQLLAPETQVQEERGSEAGRHRSPVGIVHRAYESPVPERATVDEQVPPPAREPGCIGTLDQTSDAQAVDFSIEFQKLPGLVRAPDVGYATRGIVSRRK